MKRIEKGPVRGISLRLQEEVSSGPHTSVSRSTLIFFRLETNSKTFLIIIGKREKDGLHPRALRDPGRQDRAQERQGSQADDQGPRRQEAHPWSPEGQPSRWKPWQRPRLSPFVSFQDLRMRALSQPSMRLFNYATLSGCKADNPPRPT